MSCTATSHQGASRCVGLINCMLLQHCFCPVAPNVKSQTVSVDGTLKVGGVRCGRGQSNAETMACFTCGSAGRVLSALQTCPRPPPASARPAVRRCSWEVCRRTPPRRSSGRCSTSAERSPPSARARRTSATSASARSSWWTRPSTCQVCVPPQVLRSARQDRGDKNV